MLFGFLTGHNQKWLAPLGPEEEAFNQNVHEVLFPYNDHDEPSNPNVLDQNAQWLKDHASARFYIEGYASSRGDLVYNLALSQRRAEWVKQSLISKGIPENHIVFAVGWGLYPVCSETTDESRWTKNRLVRFLTLQIESGFASSMSGLSFSRCPGKPRCGNKPLLGRQRIYTVAIATPNGYSCAME